MTAAAATAERMLTPPEVARRLGVEPEQVRAWIVRGELRGFNLAARQGGRPRWKVDPASLEEFLSRRQAQPEPQRPKRTRTDKPRVFYEY